VEIVLGRPNHLPERSQFRGFIEEREGNSYVRLAKPKAMRRKLDLHTLTFQIGSVTIRVEPNDAGYAAKLIVSPLGAKDFTAAEEAAVGITSPIIAGWSVYLDTPLLIEQVRVKDLITKRTFFRGLADQWEVWPGPAGSMPPPDYDYTHFASIYQEAICTSSAMYRFLCLYKLMEGLGQRRAKLSGEKRSNTETVKKLEFDETYPPTKDTLPHFLRNAYPMPHITTFDSIFTSQVWRAEIAGKSFTYISDNVFGPIRDKIAHSFMRDGDFGVGSHNVNQNQFLREWLPTLRCMARIRLRNEFPMQFIYQAS
jgi:hypothetical protein